IARTPLQNVEYEYSSVKAKGFSAFPYTIADTGSNAWNESTNIPSVKFVLKAVVGSLGCLYVDIDLECAVTLSEAGEENSVTVTDVGFRPELDGLFQRVIASWNQTSIYDTNNVIPFGSWPTKESDD